MTSLLTHLAFRVALLYALFGGTWILVSDRLLAAFVTDPGLLTQLQTYKGWIFVLASAGLIHFALYFELQKRRVMEEEVRRHLSELEAVNHISVTLRTATSLEQMLPNLLDETLAVLDAPAGAIWLYEPASRTLARATARGFFDRVREDRMAPGEGIAGTVFSNQAAHVSPDLAIDPRARLSLREQAPPGWGGACIPICTAQETVGVLFIAVPPPRQLTRKEIHLLSTLAEIAGNAIHRMSLFVQTERRLQRISALHAIDRTISASLDLTFILDVLLGQVITQLNVDAAAVLLLDPAMQRLEYASHQGFQIRSFNKNLLLALGEGLAGRAALDRRTVEIRDLRLEGELGAGAEVQVEVLQREEFVAYFAVPLVAKGKVKGVLEIFHRAPLDPDAEWLDFLETLAGQAAIAIDNAALFESLQHTNFQLSLAYDTTLEGWSRALELRDQETEGHTRRVVDLTLEVCRTLGLEEDELVNIRRGTLLHDIGKMAIPDQILLKPGPLDEDEWRIMRQHPVYAFQLLAPIGYLRPVLDIPYYHHEWWDGSGYPLGLKGEEIPLAARIFSLVDVWDALRSDRPYRAAWPRDKVIAYIRSQAGKQFDPRLIPLFLHVVNYMNGQ